MGATPTPWVIRNSYISAPDCAEIGNVICLKPDSHLIASMERWADNARLIVTAVNAHDDLVKYLSIFLGHDDRFQISVGGNPNALDAMLDEARAALAKAQGQ